MSAATCGDFPHVAALMRANNFDTWGPCDALVRGCAAAYPKPRKRICAFMNRAEAISRAGQHLHSGEFLAELDRRVAYPTESQNPDRGEVLRAYLEQELLPAFSELGFSGRLIELPTGKAPYLLAEVRESRSAAYRSDVWARRRRRWHGKRVARQSRSVACNPGREQDLGRGTADNKGQHSINLAALRAVHQARGGRLGFNAKFIIEMGEEIGSPDLRQVCELLRGELSADLFLASDGPRLSADRPTIFLGCRGAYEFISTSICATARTIPAIGAEFSPIPRRSCTSRSPSLVDEQGESVAR